MSDDKRLRSGHPGYDEAMALEMTVRTTRRAQGKQNPEDLTAGSAVREDATDEFLRDLLRAKIRIVLIDRCSLSDVYAT